MDGLKVVHLTPFFFVVETEKESTRSSSSFFFFFSLRITQRRRARWRDGEGRKGVPRLRIAGGSRSGDANSSPKTFTMYNSSRGLVGVCLHAILRVLSWQWHNVCGYWRVCADTLVQSRSRMCVWDTTRESLDKAQPCTYKFRSRDTVGSLNEICPIREISLEGFKLTC